MRERERGSNRKGERKRNSEVGGGREKREKREKSSKVDENYICVCGPSPSDNERKRMKKRKRDKTIGVRGERGHWREVESKREEGCWGCRCSG